MNALELEMANDITFNIINRYQALGRKNKNLNKAKLNYLLLYASDNSDWLTPCQKDKLDTILENNCSSCQ